MIYPIFFLALFISSLAFGQITPGKAGETKNIRVLIARKSKLRISGADLQVHGGQYLGNSFLSFHCGTDNKGNGYIDHAGGSRSLEPLEIKSGTGFISVDGKSYRNKITIMPDGNFCAVINTVDLEKYLAGLINKEMSPSWPVEALKAQAVAARSYALHQMADNKFREYDVEGTVLDQVYDGSSSETSKSTYVVELTKNIVLYQGTGALKAYFHANCGGITEVPEAVWGGNTNEQFRPVICPYHHAERNRKHWSVRVTKIQIENALRKIGGLIPNSFVRLARLEAGAPNANNRLNDVVVSDQAGNSLIVAANLFRSAMGTTRIKSTSFQIKKEGAEYHIEGEGFGHGVGMCQIGARAMAEEGKTFKEILQYYYPLAKITRLL